MTVSTTPACDWDRPEFYHLNWKGISMIRTMIVLVLLLVLPYLASAQNPEGQIQYRPLPPLPPTAAHFVPVAATCPNGTCPLPTTLGSIPMGPSFQYPASSCSGAGCSSAGAATSCGAGGCNSSGGLFARLRERRAARRGY